MAKRILASVNAEIVARHISTGNMKVPFYILNMNSATDCPSRKSGLCQAGNLCYALKAEKLYPGCLPYRQRQADLWDRLDARDFVDALVVKHARRRKKTQKVFRFSESGDFRTQADVNKMARIARLLRRRGWKTYGYTSRTDLDLDPLMLAGVFLNVSNSKWGWTSRGANYFKMVKAASGDNFVCVGDCSSCSMCRVKRGKTFEVVKH